MALFDSPYAAAWITSRDNRMLMRNSAGELSTLVALRTLHEKKPTAQIQLPCSFNLMLRVL
jgi:hypothetical protein